MKEGAWVVFYWDFSGLALFNAYEELEARRYATERSMDKIVLFDGILNRLREEVS